VAERKPLRELAVLIAELKVVAESLRAGATALAGGRSKVHRGDGGDAGSSPRAHTTRRGGEGTLA
jgi:hypothetical protein